MLSIKIILTISYTYKHKNNFVDKDYNILVSKVQQKQLLIDILMYDVSGYN